MDVCLENFSSLVKDALAFLQQEDPSFLLVSEEEKKFFLEKPLSKIETLPQQPTFEKKPTSLPKVLPTKPTSVPQEKEVLKVEKQKSFVLEKIEKPSFDALSDVKKVFETVAPNLFIAKIPDDAKAKKIAQKWKYQTQNTQILLLSFEEKKEVFSLLENLAKALTCCFLPAKVLSSSFFEKEGGWDGLFSSKDIKLILIQETTLQKLSSLLPHVKHFPSTSSYFLEKIPLFVLPSFDIYLKQPSLKAILWDKLSEKISSLENHE